jgi:hypothetical protein
MTTRNPLTSLFFLDDGFALPLDVLGVIAKRLIDDSAFGTCAALNVTCHAVEEERSPILWKTCVLPGAKAFARLSPVERLKKGPSFSAKQVTTMEEEMIRQWVEIRNSTRSTFIK